MYGIYANIWGILMVNVTIYSSTMDPMGHECPQGPQVPSPLGGGFISLAAVVDLIKEGRCCLAAWRSKGNRGYPRGQKEDLYDMDISIEYLHISTL